VKRAGRGGLILALVLLVGAAWVMAAQASDADLAKVRAATGRYQQTASAQQAGWDLIEGLDHCFDNPGVGAMGYHYIDLARLDTELDAALPEALVYVPLPNGRVRLGAVEYIVPADAWHAMLDAEGHDPDDHERLPEVLGRSLHLNEALGVYVLHAWVFEKNPAGMFEDWNPSVSCPA
jgi:hypothetical protein